MPCGVQFVKSERRGAPRASASVFFGDRLRLSPAAYATGLAGYCRRAGTPANSVAYQTGVELAGNNSSGGPLSPSQNLAEAPVRLIPGERSGEHPFRRSADQPSCQGCGGSRAGSRARPSRPTIWFRRHANAPSHDSISFRRARASTAGCFASCRRSGSIRSAREMCARRAASLPKNGWARTRRCAGSKLGSLSMRFGGRSTACRPISARPCCS